MNLIMRLLNKVFRVAKHLKLILKAIGYKKKIERIFSVNLISYDCSSTVFNISSLTKSKNKKLFYGREFFNTKSSFAYQKVYRAVSKDDHQRLVFEQIDDNLLKREIPFYLRLEDLRPVANDESELVIGVIITKRGRAEDNKFVLAATQAIISLNGNIIIGYTLFNTPNYIEKNWVQIASEPKFLYSLLPIQKLKLEFGENKVLNLNPVKSNTEIYRNSSNFVLDGEFYYGVGHAVLDMGIRNAYVHFFVRYSEIRREVHVSEFFYFSSLSNEFVMSCGRSGDKLEIFFSNHANGNFKATTSLNDVKRIKWMPF